MHEEQIARAAGASSCRYCGCPLVAAYYFCPNCATPYIHIERVLPPSQPTMLTEGALIARKAPAVWTIFWVYFIVVLSTGLLSSMIFQGEENTGYAMVLTSLAVLVTTCVFGAIHFASLKVQFVKIGFDRPAAYVGLLALVPVLLINYALGKMLSGNQDPMAALRESIPESLLILTICIFPAVLEETAFRGLVQHWLQAAIRPWRAMVLASALFTVMHFNPFTAPYIFMVGMLLGWTKYKTGSLYPSILIHFLHNLIVLEVLH